MLYCYNRTVNGEVAKLVIMASVSTGEFVNFKQILSSESLASQLVTFGIRVQVIVDKETNVPLLVAAESNVMSITTNTVSNVLRTRGGQVISQLAAGLATKSEGKYFTQTSLEILHKTLELFDSYLLGKDPFRVAISPLFYASVEFADLIKLHNGRLGDQPSYMSSLNKTHYMASPDDMFFVKLPDYDKLQSEDFPISAFLPKESEVASPYPHPIFSTPFIRTAIDGSPTQIKNALGELASRMNLSREQRSGVPPFDRKYLLGQDANNDLPIEPNEQEFYDALKELIMYDIKQHMNNASDDEIKAVYKKGSCSVRLLEYLREMVILFAKMNWSHNGRFPVGVLTDLEDSDDDDVQEESSTQSDSVSDNRLYLDIGDNQIFDGLEIIQGFITNAILSGVGMDAYVEAIIKLARWGKNKPTTLKLGEYQQYLDMNDIRVVSSLGSIDFAKASDIDGYSMELVGLVTYEGRIGDRKYIVEKDLELTIVSVPVGLMLHKHFGNEKQVIFMTITDAVREYEADPTSKLIKGVEVIDGVPVIPEANSIDLVSLRQVDDVVKKVTNKGYVYYVNEEIKNTVLSYEVKDLSDLNTLLTTVESETDLSRWYPLCEFHDKETLVSKIKELALPPQVFFKANMAQILVPLYLEATKQYSDAFNSDDSRIFEVYQEAMQRVNFTTSLSFLREYAPKETPVETKKEESKMSSSQSFAPTAPSLPVSELLDSASVAASLISHLIYPIQTGEEIFAIRDAENVVAGFSVLVNRNTGKKIYRLVGASKVPTGAAVSPSKFNDLVAFIFIMLTKALSGKIEATDVAFSDVSDFKEFKNYFKG